MDSVLNDLASKLAPIILAEPPANPCEKATQEPMPEYFASINSSTNRLRRLRELTQELINKIAL